MVLTELRPVAPLGHGRRMGRTLDWSSLTACHTKCLNEPPVVGRREREREGGGTDGIV